MDHWSHGADFVCTILHKHLSSLKESIPSEKWPHTLFLQVDNCWKENKNTTVFRYLGLLVKFGWFKQTYMHSLPTGHTHEDIDQMFSTWNTHYWMSGLSSPVAVTNFLNWAYPDENKRPQFQMVQYCHDFKNWFKKYKTSLKGHSQFRAFKFILEKVQLDLSVSMFYKNNSLEETWKGIQTSNNNGILLFSSFPDISENPLLIPPKPLDLELIKDLIKNPSITNSFETSCTEFYLYLQSNSTFYLIEDPPEFLFSFGFFFTQIEKVVYNSEGLNREITTDEIEQHFLRYGIQNTDVGSIVIVNIPIRVSTFYFGCIVQINEFSVKIHPVVQRSEQWNLDEKWEELSKVTVEISMEKILAKDVKFTKTFILTKKWKNYLKIQYNL